MAVVGIDLGTTNTVVGIVPGKGRQATAIRDAGRRVPIHVGRRSTRTAPCSSDAPPRNGASWTLPNTIYSIKRLIGRSWNSEEVGRARSRFPFEMQRRPRPGRPSWIARGGDVHAAGDQCVRAPAHAKALAEKPLGEPVDRAVITVPANFNDLQRAATKVAGRGRSRSPPHPERADGGRSPMGTAGAVGSASPSTTSAAARSTSHFESSGNVFEVLATAGNTFLGGRRHRSGDRRAHGGRLQGAIRRRRPRRRPGVRATPYYAEKLKVELSTSMRGAIDVPRRRPRPFGKATQAHFTPGPGRQLEELQGRPSERTFDVCADALSIARLFAPRLRPGGSLVGGRLAFPSYARESRNISDAPPDRLNPDEVVAIGAAIQANALTGAERRRSLIPRPPMPAARSLEESVNRRGKPSLRHTRTHGRLALPGDARFPATPARPATLRAGDA